MSLHEIQIVPSPRPEVESALPSYHEMLDYLCAVLEVPGAVSFYEAVEQIRRRLGGR